MKQKIYKIKFLQVGEVYEIYAKNIRQSDFYAFLEIENFIFDTKNNAMWKLEDCFFIEKQCCWHSFFIFC